MSLPAAAADPDHAVLVCLQAVAPGSRSGPALQAAAAALLDLPCAQVQLARGEHGQPQLAPPHHGLRVAASHAGPWLLLAFARGVQPGVDIEAVRPRPNALRLAERFFDPHEAAELAALPEAARAAAFHRNWSAREAVLKAIGRGLAFGPARLRIDVGDGPPRLLALAGDTVGDWQLQALDVPAGFTAALAWRGPPRPLQWITAPPAALVPAQRGHRPPRS